jgi:hypothetical protein
MTYARSLSLAVSAIVLAAASGSAVAQMAAAPMGGMAPASADKRLIQVTIENLTTGQNFSPSFFVSHNASRTPVFEVGATASEALWSVAEGGNIGPFSSAAAGALASGEIGDAVVPVHTPTGATRTFYITVDAEHPLLTGVWMLGMTNDGFGGFAGYDAYGLRGPVTLDIQGYDAGSEINNEARGFLGALGEGNMRDPENGVITLHAGIRGDKDAPAAWNFDPEHVARVTLSPVDVGA